MHVAKLETTVKHFTTAVNTKIFDKNAKPKRWHFKGKGGKSNFSDFSYKNTVSLNKNTCTLRTNLQINFSRPMCTQNARISHKNRESVTSLADFPE